MATTKEPKLELFPITEKGATTYVPKNKYVSSRSAQLSKKVDKGGLGVPCPDETVKALVAMVIKGEELDPESPKEMIQAFDLITADVKDTKEHLKELAGEEEKKKQEQIQAFEKKQAYELTLIEAATDAEVVSNFDEIFDTTNRNRCVPRGDVTDEQLVGALAFGFSLQSWSQWTIGDIVVALEDRGHENVVVQLCENFKQAYSTVSNSARVCRAITPEKRDDYTLPFNTIREIALAKYDDDDKKNVKARGALLDKAQKGNFNQKEARAAVKIAQGKEESEDSAGPKSPRYMIGNISNLALSTFTSEKPSYSDDTFVVDIKAKKYLDIQEVAPEKEGGEPTNEEVWRDFGAVEDAPAEEQQEPQEEEPTE